METQTPVTASQPALIRMKEVMKITGLGRTSIYRKMKEGTFPEPLRLGVRTVAWRSEDLNAWIAALPTRAVREG
jgi:prophage regulatory protein